jgi:hypothetical protein
MHKYIGVLHYNSFDFSSTRDDLRAHQPIITLLRELMPHYVFVCKRRVDGFVGLDNDITEFRDAVPITAWTRGQLRPSGCSRARPPAP